MYPKTQYRMAQNAIVAGLTIALVSLVGCAGGSSGVKSSAPNNSSIVSSRAQVSSNSSPPVSSLSSNSVASSAVSSAVSSSALSSNSSSMGSLDTAAIVIAPDNAGIRYNGRVNVTPAAALYDWANTQIEFRTNASRIELLLDDGKNDYNLIVDDQPKGIISTTADNTRYPAYLGLGEHHVLLTKRTGPNFGSGQFLGLRLPQGTQLLALPPAPSRKIEFIGDSYTVGYGDEGPGLDCGGVYRPYENSYLSYAPVTARALGAQSHSIAISGFGAVRNYGDANTTSATPVPFYYDRTVMSQSDLPWDFQSWVPDAVVIKLGTNDYSTQPSPSADTYIQGINGLIAQVNAAYGQVPIILLADSSLPQVIANLQTAVQQQQALGNSKVHFVQVNYPAQNLGCDWHPSVTGQSAMASELVTAIKPILGWDDSSAANLGTASVTSFKDGAKGAYSMVFDDYCAAWTSGIDDYAVPGLLSHGLRAGLGAIASECEKNNFQARLRTVSDQGFEIVSHTWSHPALVPCATKPDPNQACSDLRPDFTVEIDKARDFLQQASGAPVNFFVFPYNSVDDYTLDYLRAQGYLGARGGTYTVNPANFSDPIKLNLLGNQDDMNALADQTVAGGSFTFINFHGIADASYLPVPLAIWNDHLDHLKTLSDQHDLWIDNPTAIVKYNRTKALCGTPAVSGNTLSFIGAQAGCDTYLTGVTVSITNNAGVPDLSPVQNGKVLSTRRLSANTLLIEDVDPGYSTLLR